MSYSIVIYLFIKTRLKKLLNKTIKDNVKKEKKRRRISLSYWINFVFEMKDEDKKDGIAIQDEKKPPP